jgi:hypothetical protein
MYSSHHLSHTLTRTHSKIPVLTGIMQQHRLGALLILLSFLLFAHATFDALRCMHSPALVTTVSPDILFS